MSSLSHSLLHIDVKPTRSFALLFSYLSMWLLFYGVVQVIRFPLATSHPFPISFVCVFFSFCPICLGVQCSLAPLLPRRTACSCLPFALLFLLVRCLYPNFRFNCFYKPLFGTLYWDSSSHNFFSLSPPFFLILRFRVL